MAENTNNDTALVRDATRKLVREFDVFRNIKPALDVSLSQCHALIEIEKNGTMTLVELTRILGLNKSSISRILKGLYNSAYITQLENPEDTRVKPYALTEKGVEKLALMDEHANHRVDSALLELSPEVRQKIIEGMNLYAESLKASRIRASVQIEDLHDRHIKALKKQFFTQHVASNCSEFKNTAPQLIENFKELEAKYLVLLNEDSAPIGGGGFVQHSEHKCCILKSFFISQDYRREGLGTMLLKALIGSAVAKGYESIIAPINDNMHSARSLLISMGFTATGDNRFQKNISISKK